MKTKLFAKLLDDLLVAGDSLRIAIAQANQLPTESSYMLLEQREAEYKAARAAVEEHVAEITDQCNIYTEFKVALEKQVQSLTDEVAKQGDEMRQWNRVNSELNKENAALRKALDNCNM